MQKWYGDYQALADVTAQVRRGEVVVVCGPSGRGKSTLIRTVNRLEPIQKGVIEVDGQDIYGSKVHLDTLRSHIGFVFQQFNLFPPVGAGKPDAGAAATEARAPPRGARAGPAVAGPRGPGAVEAYPAQLSGAAAARGDRAGTGEESARDAVRRTDQRAGPRDGGRGAASNEGVGQGWHDHGVRDTRKGFAREVASADTVWFMDAGRIVEVAGPEAFFGRPETERARKFLAEIRR